jgi:hypothetical protein
VSPGKIVQLPFSEHPPIEVVEQPYWDRCKHKHTTLDPVERRAHCAECKASLDPYDVLVELANQWRRWEREAEQLRKLNADYYRIQREKWERQRDRHLNAHPDHVAGFNHKRTGWQGDRCRICYRLEVSFSGLYGEPAPFIPVSTEGAESR